MTVPVKACMFDAYGTLFDFGSAVVRCPAIAPQLRAPLSALWRDKQLQYTWLRALQERYADFEQVTSDALEFALDTLGIARNAHTPLMALYNALDVFADVPDALAELRGTGLVTAILSNGTPAMLRAAVENAGLTPQFDAIVSVDAIGTYKTSPAVYRYGAEQLGFAPAEILFVSSNGWDAWAAADFGLRAVWCNRSGQRPERLPGTLHAEIATLAALPALLDVPAAP